MQTRRTLITCLLMLALAAGAATLPTGRGAAQGAPVSYYVSPGGDDGHPGTAPDRPWRTIERVNRGRYGPGDAIRFEAGQTFRGTLSFTSANAAGTPEQPVIIGSYGDGRATIASAPGTGFGAVNVAGLRIEDLSFVGGAANNGASGLAFLALAPETFVGIAIVDVEVSGYTNAIMVLTGEPPAAYRAIHIERVSVHDNAIGIGMYGYLGTAPDGEFALSDVYVGHSEAARNTGAGLSGGYGAGMAFMNVRDLTIEHNRVYDNGGANPEESPNGPSGIIVYDGLDVLIQDNEIARQRMDVNNQADSAGIDLWAERALVQYNRIHDNEGWGMILGSGDGGFGVHWAGKDVTIRYNLFLDNGRPLPDTETTVDFLAAAILAFGHLEGTYELHNNVFYRGGPTTPGVQPPIVQGLLFLADLPPQGKPFARMHFRNNVVVALGESIFVQVGLPTPDRDLTFEGNAYVGDGAARPVIWGTAVYTTLDAWRAGTGAETVAGHPVGITAAPAALCAVDPAAPSAFRPAPDSSLIDAGLDLAALFDVDPGPRDLAGRPIPTGAGFDIGAFEAPAAVTCGS